MGKKNKTKTMGAVPSMYYEMNVDGVIEDESAPPTDVDGNKVYEEVVANAEAEIQKARDLLVQEIGEELPSEVLGVIDVSGTNISGDDLSGGEVAPPSSPEEKKDDDLSQKQKQQKGGYNGWWWWKK